MQPLAHIAIQLHPSDNVAIAKQDIAPATVVTMPTGAVLSVADPIPAGHKLALCALAPGDAVLRYGYRIGNATRAIAPGEWVHTHNLATGDIGGEYAYTIVPNLTPQPARTSFLGYARADGRVGTRNYLAVIATANCAARVVIEIARAFTPERLAAYPNVDGVVPIVHWSGCCSKPGDRMHRYLQRTLANIAHNPNIAAALFVGLGCETNQIDGYCDAAMLNLDPATHRPYPLAGTGMVIQDQGGFRPTVAAGIAAIEQMLPRVNATGRTPQPVSALTLALQCGASDGWSGVTANPLVGWMADELIQQGGTAVLAETPEIFGAEHLLTQRVVSAAVAEKLIERLKWWSEQARVWGFSVDNNPSPGNKRGGLTTIFEKSLGAVAKGGRTPLAAVYEYAERVTARGLVFMDTPGYDPASVTGQLAGGCNLILFTTGRGSLFGSSIAPCLKIASNSALFARLRDDMDFDAGQLLEDVPLAEAAHQLWELVLAVASGARTRSEQNGSAEHEFVPWQPGAIV